MAAALLACFANNKTLPRSFAGWHNSHGWLIRIPETHYKLPGIVSRLACRLSLKSNQQT